MKLKKYNEFINENLQGSQYDQEGEYVGIKVRENSLELYLTDEGREYLVDNNTDEFNFFDCFEDIQVNSDIEYHPDLGSRGFGLTEAPGFTIGFGYNDGGDYDDVSGEGKLYYYDKYMLKSFIEELKRNGVVYFQEQK